MVTGANLGNRASPGFRATLLAAVLRERQLWAGMVRVCPAGDYKPGPWRDGVIDAIVPGLWTRMDREKLPYVAQSVQFDHKLLGERYCAEGFYGIMKLQNYPGRLPPRCTPAGRADHRYRRRERPLPRTRPPRSAWQWPTSTRCRAHSAPASARRTADGQLHIAVLAHDASTLPPGRASDYYGDTPDAWSPYRPDYPQPVADYAQEFAKRSSPLDCKPLVGVVDRDMANWSSNGRPVPPSLYLVDAWVSLSSQASGAAETARLGG